jgi:hypothetical protein
MSQMKFLCKFLCTSLTTWKFIQPERKCVTTQ